MNDPPKAIIPRLLWPQRMLITAPAGNLLNSKGATMDAFAVFHHALKDKGNGTFRSVQGVGRITLSITHTRPFAACTVASTLAPLMVTWPSFT